jgi:hypothetical protein
MMDLLKISTNICLMCQQFENKIRDFFQREMLDFWIVISSILRRHIYTKEGFS